MDFKLEKRRHGKIPEKNRMGADVERTVARGLHQEHVLDPSFEQWYALFGGKHPEKKGNIRNENVFIRIPLFVRQLELHRRHHTQNCK